jgi:hypothetical protein
MLGLYAYDLGKGPVAGCCEHSIAPSGSIKCEEFLTSWVTVNFSGTLLHGVGWLVTPFLVMLCDSNVSEDVVASIFRSHAARSSEASAFHHIATRRHNTRHLDLNFQRPENLTSHHKIKVGDMRRCISYYMTPDQGVQRCIYVFHISGRVGLFGSVP